MKLVNVLEERRVKEVRVGVEVGVGGLMGGGMGMGVGMGMGCAMSVGMGILTYIFYSPSQMSTITF